MPRLLPVAGGGPIRSESLKIETDHDDSCVVINGTGSCCYGYEIASDVKASSMTIFVAQCLFIAISNTWAAVKDINKYWQAQNDSEHNKAQSQWDILLTVV